MEQILEILFGAPEGVTLGLGPLAIAGIGAGINLIGGLFGAGKARRQARRMEAKQREYEGQLKAAEASRQAVINPYANVRDLSSMISNPYANLQVATKAADIQAAQTDLSLATTLDTLLATGAGAGGATALAQAAARSKQGIAASIEQQETANARARAEGQLQMQQTRMAEAQRLQQADISGKQFMFTAKEQREMQKLDRLSALSSQYMGLGAQARTAQQAAIGGAFGSVGGALIGAAGDLGN
jgi:hypothetical protein